MLLFGDVGLDDKGGLASGLRSGKGGQDGGDHKDGEPRELAFDECGGDKRQKERDAVDAGDGSEARQVRPIDGGVAQQQPGEAGVLVGPFEEGPERGGGGNCPGGTESSGSEPAECQKLEAFRKREEDKEGPSSEFSGSRVVRECELDPVTEAEPEENAGGVGIFEVGLALERVEERDEGDGSQEREIEAGEDEDEKYR